MLTTLCLKPVLHVCCREE